MTGRPHRPSLRSVLARWDALVMIWDLRGDERSTLLGGPYHGPVTDVATYELLCAEQRMRLLVELSPMLAIIYPDVRDLRDWLREPNENLEERTPIEVMSRSPEWISWLIETFRWKA